MTAKKTYLNNPEVHAQVRALHETGISMLAISRQVGCSASTIQRIAEIEGLHFNRGPMAAAIAAKTIDNKARRAVLVERLYNLADSQIDRLEAATYTKRVSAGPNSFVVTDDTPNSDDVRNHTQAIYSALAAAKQLEQLDVDPGAAAARSALQQIGAALGIEKRE